MSRRSRLIVGKNIYQTIKNLKVTNIGNTAVMEYELGEIAEGRMEDIILPIFRTGFNKY